MALKELINKNGLKRYIPADVAREVRQKSGFGCVICGAGITDYEHVDPEFKDAFKHDSACMCLLCPTCHRKKGGFITVKKIKAAMESPFCKQAGFSSDSFFLDDWPKVIIGNSTFTLCKTIVRVRGYDIFSVNPPVDKDEPYTISAIFCDPEGLFSLVIDHNQWFAPLNNWDVAVSMRSVKITDSKGVVNLEMIFQKDNVIEIRHLKMQFLGKSIIVDKKKEIKFILGPGEGVRMSGVHFADFQNSAAIVI